MLALEVNVCQSADLVSASTITQEACGVAACISGCMLLAATIAIRPPLSMKRAANGDRYRNAMPGSDDQ